MSKLCGSCDEKHDATHYCTNCQEFMCSMLAGLHPKLKATKSHTIQDLVSTSDLQANIAKALKKLQQARNDIFVQLGDASPPLNATSPLAEQRAYDLFTAFINTGALLNRQHEELRDMQRLLPKMDQNALTAAMSNQVLNPDIDSLNRYIAALPPFINTLGSSGSENGHFNDAVDVAVSTTGEVYVCDSINQVQVFTPDGEFVRAWNTLSGLPPRLESHPVALSVSPCDDVFIIQHPHHVSRFTPEGSHVCTWNDNDAIDIATAPTHSSTVVFVLSAGARPIVRVFTPNGDFLRMWHAPHDSISLCVGSERILSDQRVYVITPNVCHVFNNVGQLVTMWGGLIGAKKVTAKCSRVYVAEENRVRVFDTGGLGLRAVLGHSKAPRAVAVHGHQVYVCESHSVEIALHGFRM